MEKRISYQKEYYRRNRERLISYQKDYYQRNRETILKYNYEYYRKRHPPKLPSELGEKILREIKN